MKPTIAFLQLFTCVSICVAQTAASHGGQTNNANTNSPAVTLDGDSAPGTTADAEKAAIPGVKQTPAATNESETITAPVPAVDTAPKPKEKAEEDNAYKEITVLTEALMIIRRHYVDELTYNEIIGGALDGMLHSLDPHSYFMQPDEFGDFQQDTEGEFSGVGITIGIDENRLTVISPIEDSPAAAAGVKAGDKIVKIDDVDSSDMDISEAAKRLRGKNGTDVTLTLAGSNGATRDVKITRARITVPSVKDVSIIKPGIGFIRITQFTEKVQPAFEEALEKLKNDGMRALIIDLRGNPGGLLAMAAYVSEQFLERGKTIVSVKGRGDAGGDRIIKASCRKPLKDIPVAVLINGGSASASEVVAGALQDNHRAVVIGRTSYGKASVQTVVPLESDPKCGIKLTTAHYYTPGNRLIHGKGITPDIEVDTAQRGDKQSNGNADDIALQRAEDVLTAVLAISRKN